MRTAKTQCKNPESCESWSKKQEWLGYRDLNPDYTIQSRASYQLDDIPRVYLFVINFHAKLKRESDANKRIR